MSQVVVVHFANFHFDYYSIIPHRTKPQVLMLCDENGWSLPWFVPDEHHFGVVNHINQAIAAQLGCNVTVLRCFYEDYSLETKNGCRVYAMENHSPQWTPPENSRWVGFEELDSLKFVIPKLRQVLDSWFADISSKNIPKMRVPWAQIGWFERATDWINLQLYFLGVNTTAPIQQVKSQTRSCLLKISTTDGEIYFKATFGIFASETIFTKSITEFYPEHLPELLIVDTQKSWMLMPDFGGKHLGKIHNIFHWKKALNSFAKMQIQASSQVEKLLAIGFTDRRIEQIISQIELLFADNLLVPQDDPRLSSTEIEALRSLIPQLRAMCNELAICGIPQTLVHGDFHCENVILTDEKFIYFDWSDGAVSHPFFDAVFFLEDITQQLPDISDVQVSLRNAYLEPWTVYMPIEQLISVFAKVQPLAYLYYAVVSYEITQSLEVSHRWENEEAVSYWLKKLLNCSEQTE
ncbi:phosphotransferase [Dendronalium sp. ChiSLP03b]|uniref:phosphotransferase n=1 Tax=Dendronalium sp. ChiSLP03b TaxID=3075381 RepID=UPI002AD2EBB9|nr:phosphotransferase [Dendronalium sp. ChiSLP03b]MDZ8203657.1 phosphotransferase [Dendronalium sp. ChiSLP03b]